MTRLAPLLLLLVSLSAAAHPEFNPNTVNRYAKFDLVSSTSLRLAYTVMVGEAPAYALRKQFDADHSGSLDDQESAALGQAVIRAATDGITLELDGQPVHPHFEIAERAPREVMAQPFSIDLIAFFSLGKGEHRVRFEDNVDLPPSGESEIVVLESPFTQLLYSRRGPQGDDKQSRFLFRTPKRSALQERSVEFAYRPSAHTPTEQPFDPKWIAVLVALLGAALLFGYRKLKG